MFGLSKPQPKAQAGAKLAQQLNQAPDSIPGMFKPGEFVLPPDTVHAMGGKQALQGVVDATHTPVQPSFGLNAARASVPSTKEAPGLGLKRKSLPDPGPEDAPRLGLKPEVFFNNGGAPEDLLRVGARTVAPYVNHRAPNGPAAMPAQPQLGNSVPPQTGLQTTGYKPNFTMGGSDPLNAQSRVVPNPNGVTDARPKYNPANGSPEAKAWQAQRAAATPTSPAPAPAASASASPQSAGYRAGAAVGRGIAPVMKAAGAVALPATLAGTASAAAETPTSDYEKRFGFEPNSIEGVGGLARDVGVRALGAASDLGDALTLGMAGKYLYADKQANAAPAAPASATPTPTTAGTSSQAQSTVGSGRGLINPTPANPNAPPPTVKPVATEVQPGVYNHGRGQYSDQAGGMGLPAGFTGRPNAQNDAAAGALAQTGAGGFGLRRPSQPETSQPEAGGFGLNVPGVAHSGNDWAARQRLKNLETSASSIMNTERWGGRGASHNPAVQNFVDASRADLAAQGKVPEMQLKTNEINAGLKRTAMAEAGADRRAKGQIELGKGQLALGAQRNSIDAQRASSDERLREPQIRAAERMGHMQETLLNAKTPEEQAAIAAQIRAYSGKEDQPNRFTVVPGGQEWDTKANVMRNVPASVLNNQTGQFVDRGGQMPASAPSENNISVLRANPGLKAEFDLKFGAGAAARYLG